MSASGEDSRVVKPTPNARGGTSMTPTFLYPGNSWFPCERVIHIFTLLYLSLLHTTISSRTVRLDCALLHSANCFNS